MEAVFVTLAFVTSSIADAVVHTPPLATAVVLTCNRPQWALLAARQIAAQDYRPLEALVVDDSGTSHLEALLRREHPGLEIIGPDGPEAVGGLRDEGALNATSTLLVRLLVLPRRVTIGEKRSVAARAARGEVVLHWDDDDFFAPTRVSAQVEPIAAGEAAVSALQLSHFMAMPGVEAYELRPSHPFHRGVLYSSLAYKTSLGRELQFANVSLGEDVDFGERAVQARKLTDPPPSLHRLSITPPPPPPRRRATASGS